MSEPGSYTFVPYFRQGLAAQIEGKDDPAAAATGRAFVDARVGLSVTALPGANPAVPPITQRVEMVSPGDIAAIKADDMVLRVHPPANSREATPGELAFVEFYDEDLPWRYTPAQPATPIIDGQPVPRLRPWLALFVLTAAEFEVTERLGRPAVLGLTAAATLPPPDEHWAWGHAQLSGLVEDPAQAGGQARRQPDAAVSRLLCPRRLEPFTAYTAFLVPAFDTGRRAGLQLALEGVPAQRPSWGPAQPDPHWPVYVSWTFATSGDGSFEYFCRSLTAQAVGPEFGRREMDVSAVGYGLDDVAIAGPVQLEGALQPPAPVSRLPYPSTPGPSFVTALQELVDAGNAWLQPGADVPDDPGIVPTAYGARHAVVDQLGDVGDGDPAGWVRELNLDLRQRAAAGLGAQIVRDRQDELMTRAWEQVSSLREVNQRLREAEFTVAATSAVFAKHLGGSDEDRAMLITGPSHDGLAGAGGRSVSATVVESRVPSATGDPAFRRVTRPTRPLMRNATAQSGVAGFRDGTLLSRFNSGSLSAAPPVPEPVITVSLAAIGAATQQLGSRLPAKLREPKRVFWTLCVAELRTHLHPDGTVTLPARADLQGALRTALTAWAGAPANAGADTATIATAVGTVIDSVVDVRPDGSSSAVVVVDAVAFAKAFGTKVASKGGDGVTIASSAPPAGGLVTRMADDDAAGDYGTGIGATATDLATRLVAAPPEPPAVGDLAGLATSVVAGLRPADTVTARVVAGTAGLGDVLDRQAAQRARMLQPVLAYPTFPDPMIRSLQLLGRDYVLPNIGDLPESTMTLMQPNQRFLEAFFAGLNTEFARELLWREYPTDQRGSYARTFWERLDALGDPDAVDVKPLADWVHALGRNAPGTDLPLVLVLRSELLRKFPNTVVYAQRAKQVGAVRTLDLDAAPLHPSFHGDLPPDVGLFGFTLTEDAARGTGGDPGYFFVLKERPGQPRFGLDVTVSTDYDSWDDLAWTQLTMTDDYLALAANPAVAAPTDPEGATWGATSADLASILFRSPVMYARHADDMLPPP